MTKVLRVAVTYIGIALISTSPTFADVCQDMIDANRTDVYRQTPISKLDPNGFQVLISQADMCAQSADKADQGEDVRALTGFEQKLRDILEATDYRPELLELIKRTRALPNDPSSSAALQRIKVRLIEIRNNSSKAFNSNEWAELDTAIDDKADDIQSAQAQPANPSPNPPALQNFANQSSSDPRISEMTCSVRGTAVLGVPNMGSEDPENEVEVGLTSAGDFIVEGKQIAAVDVVRNGGAITLSMISVEDYLLAGSKDATGASMGLSDDENMQFQAMQKMFLGGALHGRKRFAIYDVANSRLAFADADGQRFKNIAEARCMAN